MSETKVTKAWYKRWYVWVLAVVIIVGISQAGKKETPLSTDATTGPAASSSAPVEPKEAPALSITAKEYFDAYENEVSGDSRFKGKRIAISGEVDGVSKTLGTVSVNLKADEYIKQVRCKLKNEADAASLTKGQTVTLVGLGDGKSIFPQVEDCVVQK